MKYKEQDYLDIDLYDGDKDDGGIRCHSSKIVKTRSEHECRFKEPVHIIAIGSHARLEKGLLDGEWVSFYCCTNCMERWIEQGNY